MQTYYKNMQDAAKDYLNILKYGGEVFFQDEWGRSGALSYHKGSFPSFTCGVIATYDRPVTSAMVLQITDSPEPSNRICGGIF
jgi:hypothetical protein